jgi:hypothetical protein
MIKVTLPTGSYKLPEDWDEVSFELLLKLRAIDLESLADSKILFMASIISTILGCDKKEILSLDSDSFVILSEKVEWFNKFDIKPTFKKEFTFNDKNYTLVDNFDKLSIGEQASIEQYLMQGGEENADKIIAVILREKGEDGKIVPFDADTIDARAEVFRKNMLVTDVQGLTNFITAGEKTSTETTPVSSAQTPMITLEKMEK